MQILESLPFSQPLTPNQIRQLHQLLRQMANEIGASVLTEASLPTPPGSMLEVVQFMLIASSEFSVLLANWSESPALETCQTVLTFEPATIATFLNQLGEFYPAHPEFCQTIADLQALPQINNAQRQSEFTLKLIAILTTPPEAHSISMSAARVKYSEQLLRQQVEQERLLNQVTTQIRQSLELPVILQTAVEQVRQCLQVDRLVIYRLDLSDSDMPTVLQPNSFLSHAAWENLEGNGSVIYESRVADSIPSVLNFSEAHCFVSTPNPESLSEQDLAIAVEDVEIRYAEAPCLLDFLQQAQVRAKLVAPISIGRQLWGLLIAHQCFEPRDWQFHERRFLQKIAEHLAIAISQAQLYTQLQQQKRTLEQRVIERTQELHDVMQAAQAANRAKSEFLAVVSHELRTPLTCIIGMSATLQRWASDSLTDRQRNFLQTIQDSGEYLLTLINDILDLSQVEAGKMLLDLSEFSLSRLAQQTLKAFEGQATLSEVNLELDLRLSPQHDRFIADPRRLQQILFNLLDNAIKFTPQGGKVMLRVLAEESLAVFQVKDQGIGIPEEQLPLLFQKFRQLNSGYHRQYRGTGLGLALTKQLVELHGGWIDVESTEGVGSIFTVRLPMPQDALPQSILKTRNVTVSNSAKGRIVLIEHQEENADLICDVLTAAGYQIVWMLEGSAAVNQIEILQPIAVIANTQLPDIDSVHLIHCLRKNPATKHLKIITIVPSSTVGAEISLQQSDGADDYLVQPIRPDFLLQKVMALTEQTDIST
ncbi:hybrid sensor histidine kinase/response regulator [Egbenema bharatensis]|uniref:hybrid sensor histidine kinase/response regulator n=1 Tax=Egbenema bharatensis TaxID=3463334 RepID=UPI003A8A7189